MRDLIYICAQPANDYYVWQVALWLQSLQDLGEDDKAYVLLYEPITETRTNKWEKLQLIYPKATFAYYKDSSISGLIKMYIPVIRPFVLAKYFKEHPELTKKAIFYCDSDILFTRKPDIDKFLDDEVCYLSDTNSYINSNYLKNKVNDVLPHKLEEYKTRDMVGEMAYFCGITKERVEEGAADSGGAQYLLKNIDYKFWEKVMTDCVVLHLHLKNVNKTFFASEEKGIQSWCADMWAVLYALWNKGLATKVVPELEFAWATDVVEKLDKVAILHNAGVTGDSVIRTRAKDKDGNNIKVDGPAFYKGKFKDGQSPYSDMSYLQAVINSDISSQYCTHYYTNYLLKNKEKFNILYA